LGSIVGGALGVGAKGASEGATGDDVRATGAAVARKDGMGVSGRSII